MTSRSRAGQEEVRRLETQIEDLQSALAAISQGGVDAVVVHSGDSAEVYTLATADRPYRVILEDMADGAVTLSESGVVLFANRAFCELVGAPRSDLLGQDLTRFVTPENAADLVRCTGVGPGESRHVELSLVAGDAGSRMMQVAASGLEQQGARVSCLVFTDVTERHRTSVLLAEAADRFSAVFDEAPVGMALVDVDGQILRSNRALGSMLGIDGPTLVGKSLLAWVLPEDRILMIRGLEELFRARSKGFKRELRMTGTPGRELWVNVSASVVAARTGDHAVVHLEDISARKSYEGRLQELADRDPLTGLSNRRRFHEDLTRWIATIGRHGGRGAVMLIDLDNFKYVNDTLGHQSGDRLLKAVGTALRQRTRASDLVGRLGGDEFAVALVGVDSEQAIAVASSYLDAIKTAEVDVSGTRVRATGSIGVVLVDEESGSTVDDLLADADVAMYQAKDAGRDAITVFDSASARVRSWRDRFRALDIVRDALEDDLFVLYAQPILDLSTRTVAAYELLLRIQQGEDVMMPADFLDVAERHGLGPAIDRKVVEIAMSIIPTAQVPEGTRWEINLSASSLNDEALLREIELGVRRSGIDPGSIVFEVTETAAISNIDQARRFVEQLGRVGCLFALDDFGAGYGSFYNLKHLPFDFLKIDGEFVRDLTTEHGDSEIVRAIVAAAKGLGKQTIAEYVRDADIMQAVAVLGVDFAQGFHVGRPLPLAESVAACAGREF